MFTQLLIAVIIAVTPMTTSQATQIVDHSEKAMVAVEKGDFTTARVEAKMAELSTRKEVLGQVE